MILWFLLTCRRSNILDREMQFRSRTRHNWPSFLLGIFSVTVCVTCEPPHPGVPRTRPLAFPFWLRSQPTKPALLTLRHSSVLFLKSLLFPEEGYSPQELCQNKNSQYPGGWVRRLRDFLDFLGEICSLSVLGSRDHTLHIFFSRLSSAACLPRFQHNPQNLFASWFVSSVLILLNVQPLSSCKFTLLLCMWHKPIMVKSSWRTIYREAKGDTYF